MTHFKLFSAIILSLMFIGCNQETSESSSSIDKEAISTEIMSVWENIAEALESGDLNKSMTYYTDDYINMPMYGVTQDYQQAKAMGQNLMNIFTLENYEVEQDEIFVYGDMAYEFASVEMEMINKTSGDTIPNNFRAFTVWKKMDDGSWKVYRSLGQN